MHTYYIRATEKIPILINATGLIYLFLVAGVKKLDFLQTFSVASNYILFRYLVFGIPP